MPSEPQTDIQELRASFVWTALFDRLLGHQDPYRFLAKPSTYKAKLSELRANRPGRDWSDINILTLPWRGGSGHHFWEYYLGEDVSNARPNRVYNLFVPFRFGKFARISPEGGWDDVRMTAEAYYYRHGVSLAITFYVKADLSLEGATRLLVQLVREGDFLVERVPGESLSRSLQGAAGTLLGGLVVRASSGGETAGVDRTFPFSLTAVIRGRDKPEYEAETPIEVRRALQAWTTWSHTWEQDRLGDWEERLLDSANRGREQQLYGSQRGRALWAPASFSGSERAVRALSCYHRNLLIASLHTDSLGKFLQKTAAQLSSSRAYEDRLYARKAAEVLASIHRGALVISEYGRQELSTYRSWSLRSQIDDNGYRAAADAVLTDNGLPAIE